MTTLEEIEKRRADRRSKQDTARNDQELVDLTAIDALEEADGSPLHTMTANGFTPGVPVKIAFKAPTAMQYRRYCDQVGAAQKTNDPKARIKAQETLAECCLVYPSEGSEARTALYQASPGTLISLAIEAAKVAELRAEDEGKG